MRMRQPTHGSTREPGARRAAFCLVLLVWLLGIADRGALEGGRGAAGAGDPPAAALAPLTVDPARDPPWRLRLIPGIGTKRAAELVAAREAAAVLAPEAGPRAGWRTLRDLLEARGLSAGTLRALLDARRQARTPGHMPVVRIRLAGEQPVRP